MTLSIASPELLILLSRDKISLHLASDPDGTRPSWKASFPVPPHFLEDEIATVIDGALLENEALLEHFERVELLVLDQPNLCIPRSYENDELLEEIADRYLRSRNGDMVSIDATPGNHAFLYRVPKSTLHTWCEYYSNLNLLHISPVLWTAIQAEKAFADKSKERLYITVMDHILILLGESNGRLSFSNIFIVQDQNDVVYYALACSRMLKPDENCWVTVNGETGVFDLQKSPHFTIHQHIELPSLQELISQYRSCEL